MKQLFFVLLLLACLLGACNTQAPVTATATSAPLPVIVVDQQHMDTAGLAYDMSAGDGFVLDASRYDFGPATPTAVQVVAGSAIYQTTWTENATQQAVLVSDLNPLLNTKTLTTFSSGQQLIVSIGSLTMQGRFKPLWVAVIDVK